MSVRSSFEGEKLLRKDFPDAINELGESIESWYLSVLTQNDGTSDPPRHISLENQSDVVSLIQRLDRFGDAIDDLGRSIGGLDPSNSRPDDCELTCRETDSTCPSSQTHTTEATSPNELRVSEQHVMSDDEEDLYGESEISEGIPTSLEKSTERPSMSLPGQRQNEGDDESDGAISITTTALSTKMADRNSNTNNDDSLSALLSTGGTKDEEIDDDEDIYGETEPSSDASDYQTADYHSAPEVDDPNRCLSIPVLEPGKDLTRCICGIDSGFEDLRNENGDLIAIQCCHCAAVWLREISSGMSNVKMKREGNNYTLNIPIQFNTAKLSKTPISSLSELRRGDHVMFCRKAYYHHAIVVEVLSQGIKVFHWGYKGNNVQILLEDLTISEEDDLSKVTYDKEDPAELVVARAARGKVNGVGIYHIFENNCESYATFCKTGHFVSIEGKAAQEFFPGIVKVLEYFNFSSS